MIVNKQNITHTFTRHIIGCWLVLVLFSITNSYGQQAIQFSQYFSNQLVINPAYAGSEDALSITMVHRNQWTGINGAPTTTTLSGHTLFKNEHIGLGINMFVDKINIHKSSNFLGIYSYRIKVSNSSYLSMGLQAGIENIKSDYTSLSGGITDPNDPYLGLDYLSETSFQFGTGLYFKSPRLEIGLSAPILFSSTKSKFAESEITPKTSPHYFLYSRYKINLSPGVQLNPGLLLKAKPGWPMAVDLNVDAIFNQVLLLGLSYRSFESLSLIIQANILPQMKLGYAYDYPLSTLKRRHFNSHELMLNYIFHYKEYNIKSPR